MTKGNAKGGAQLGQTSHQGGVQGNTVHTTENSVQMMEKLKRAIREDYNVKANILGPTACSMAMQLDLCNQLNKPKGQLQPAVGNGNNACAAEGN